MNEMIEVGLRGGMTQTTCKKIDAKIYMGSYYDQSNGSSEINYLNANNLYMWFKHETRTTI